MAALGAVGELLQVAPTELAGVTFTAAHALHPTVDYGGAAILLNENPVPNTPGWGWFGLGVEGQFGSTSADRIDWANDTIKIAIVDTPPNQDTAQFWSDVSSTEVSGTGYTAGGQALGSKSLTYSASTNRISFGCSDSVWTAATFTNGRYAIIYKDTGSAGTSPLIGFLSLGRAYSPAAQDFTVHFDGGVALYATV